MIVNISFKHYWFSFQVKDSLIKVSEMKENFRQSINDLIRKNKPNAVNKESSLDHIILKFKLINYRDLEPIVMPNCVLKLYEVFEKYKIKEMKDFEVLKIKSLSFPQIYNLGLAVVFELPPSKMISESMMPIENLISYCTNSNFLLEARSMENEQESFNDTSEEGVNVMGLLSSLMNINNPSERDNIIRLILPLVDNPRSNIIMNERRQDDVTIMNLPRSSIISRLEANEELVSNLVSLGFSESEARWGLSQTNNNLEQAADLIINQLN